MINDKKIAYDLYGNKLYLGGKLIPTISLYRLVSGVCGVGYLNIALHFSNVLFQARFLEPLIRRRKVR